MFGLIILGSFGLFCLLCGFRQLGNLFGTDRNGFRIGGGLLSFALSGFFVFFFGLAVLGLTVRVSVFGITVLGIAILVSVFGVAIFFGFLLGLFALFEVFFQSLVDFNSDLVLFFFGRFGTFNERRFFFVFSIRNCFEG